jgi:uncharacterized membrane protein YgcG
MQVNKSVAIIGLAVGATLVVSGCSQSGSSGGYETVKAAKGEYQIPDWKSKNVKPCEHDEYAVYKDKKHRKQKCFEPSSVAYKDKVTDWSLTNRYRYLCDSKHVLAYVPDSDRKLLFCPDKDKVKKFKVTPTPSQKNPTYPSGKQPSKAPSVGNQPVTKKPNQQSNSGSSSSNSGSSTGKSSSSFGGGGGKRK